MYGKVRRPAPGLGVREVRALNLLHEMQMDGLELGELPSPGLEPGNKKTGLSGGRFKSVMVWNLPPATTCPGASDWCLSVCYNGDDRPDVFQKEKWRANLLAFRNDPTSLAVTLHEQIDSSEQPLAVRIHSSGDFFSNDYIRFWEAIIDGHPDVTFWAYTRSWAVPELADELAALKAKSNIQLFASWDETMDEPPDGWRISFVKDENSSVEFPSNLTKCPEEFIDGMNCARCGFCLRNVGRGVLFNAH